MIKNNSFNIIIIGVGGQGLIILTQIIAEAAMMEDLEVKTSELHGISQRGGSVETHIRFGKKIYSPLVDFCKADLILGLEMQESLRAMSFASPKAVFAINENFLVYFGGLSRKEVSGKMKSLLKNRLHLVPASEICRKKFSNEVVSGIYLLGYAVSRGLIPLKRESVLKAIERVVPEKYLKINKEAFNLAKK